MADYPEIKSGSMECRLLGLSRLLRFLNKGSFISVIFATEQKAVEQAKRDQAKAAEAFQELDDDADGM